MSMHFRGQKVSPALHGKNVVSAHVAVVGEPIDPERVTATTDSAGWFNPDTPVSSPLVNSINSRWELVTAAPVISTVKLRDWEQERSWEPGEVIPAGSALHVPPEVVQGEMQVILAEPHDTAQYPQAVVGLAGPGEWETSTQAEWQRVVDEAVGMGMKWIRVTAPWKLIEPDRGVRDWSALDSRISACTTAGLQPLVLILGQPDWAQGIHTTQASAMSGWSDFCAALADRYQGQVTAYEVWNEPNLDRFWDGANVASYIELLKAASTAIRGADPSALIVSAGLAPATTVAGEDMEPLAFLQSVLDGAASYLDHVGWHPYCWPDRPLSGAPWSTWTKMHAAHQKMESAGVAGQLWLTEYGMPTDGGEGAVTEQEQADQLVEGIRHAALEPYIGPLFTYTLDDGSAGGGTEGYFGLIREDGTPKPAQGAVANETRRTVVRWANVWSRTPTLDNEVVKITLGTGFEARDQFQAALAARGLNYQTVVKVPFDIELVGTGSATAMFRDCSSLTSVPDMDTSQVTSMPNMFWGCSSLTSVPSMDTAQVTDMTYMFRGCSALTSVPDMNTAQVTFATYMFQGCAALMDGNVRLIGRHPDLNAVGMIEGSGLTREPFL